MSLLEVAIEGSCGMLILGFLGSPKVNGHCSKLLNKALEGAESKGATTKRFDLVKLNIKYCMGCNTCYRNNPELIVGKCPIKDDVASILEEYVKADGYIFASPVYDATVTALLKTFLERKIMLTYKAPDAYGKLPESRCPANFKRKAAFIVTGAAADEFKEVMADPCFEAIESSLMLEQVDTSHEMYVGGVENITEERFAERLDEAYRLGAHLVEEIEKEQ
jgi:multimeric flavodoxin WrbA